MPFARFDKLDLERRRLILNAAGEEFAENGFEGASYNRIIERCGISKGAMYYYFADKDDLYRTVLADAAEQWIRHAGALPDVKSADDFWRACRAMHRSMLAFLADAPVQASLCFRIAAVRARGGTSHPALEEVNARFEEFLGGLVRYGQKLGAVRVDVPNELLLQMSTGLLEGIDRWIFAEPSRFDPERLDALVEITVGALERLARPEASVPSPSPARKPRSRR
jgi:AcrR family transcriptional regulator